MPSAPTIDREPTYLNDPAGADLRPPVDIARSKGDRVMARVFSATVDIRRDWLLSCGHHRYEVPEGFLIGQVREAVTGGWRRVTIPSRFRTDQNGRAPTAHQEA